MTSQTPGLEHALRQIEPLLDAYCEGQLGLDSVTDWLSSYEAQLGDRRDETWVQARPRIWSLLSELENGYGDEVTVHRGLQSIARDLAPAR